METGKQLLAESEKALRKASNTTPKTTSGKKTHSGEDNKANAKLNSDQISAINQMFAELELAYHNQFHKAFPGDKLQVAKQLWAHTLVDLSAAEILRGCRKSIKTSPFLPTLHTIRENSQFDPSELGLPEVRTAYLEACRAPSPKSDYEWSHAAVYHAGQASDWYFLASTGEAKAFPVFKRNYEILCERIMAGEDLAEAVPLALPKKDPAPLSPEENRERMAKLKSSLNW